MHRFTFFFCCSDCILWKLTNQCMLWELHDRFIAYAIAYVHFSRWLYCIYVADSNIEIYIFLYYSMSLFNSFALDFISTYLFIPIYIFAVCCLHFFTFFSPHATDSTHILRYKTSRIYIQTIPIYLYINIYAMIYIYSQKRRRFYVFFTIVFQFKIWVNVERHINEKTAQKSAYV